MNVYIVKTTNPDINETITDAYAAKCSQGAIYAASNVADGIDWGQSGISESCYCEIIATLNSDAATVAESLS